LIFSFNLLHFSRCSEQGLREGYKRDIVPGTGRYWGPGVWKYAR